MRWNEWAPKEVVGRWYLSPPEVGAKESSWNAFCTLFLAPHYPINLLRTMKNLIS